MNTKHTILRSTLLVLTLAGPFGFAFAGPAVNVSPHRHPNLAAAQQLSAEAFERLNAAQQANEFDLGGHAAHAKQLLMQANDEIKAAALAANQRAR
jgi:hypothetical protein